jgi:hypothetical protein
VELTSRISGEGGDRREAADRIAAHVAVQRGRDGLGGGPAEQRRVAIGRRPRTKAEAMVLPARFSATPHAPRDMMRHRLVDVAHQSTLPLDAAACMAERWREPAIPGMRCRFDGA